MIERMMDNPWPPMVGKLRREQADYKGTWAAVPDNQTILGGLHNIRIVPRGLTTVTEVNPMDPGDGSDGNWYDPPGSPGHLVRVQRP